MSITNHGYPTGDNGRIDRGCLMRCLQKGDRREELFTKIDEQIKQVPIDIWEQLYSKKSPDFVRKKYAECVNAALNGTFKQGARSNDSTYSMM
eukprot:8412888-Pyramimonas_sp.AAC.1